MAKLYFRYGTMNCGKSTVLMQVAHNYEENDRKVVIVKSTIDTKADDQIESRIGIRRKVDILIHPDESFKPYYKKWKNKIACILVDEAQFLTKDQVDELWDVSKELNIPVICYGLRTDFSSHVFPGSLRLFELADELEEIITICSCGKRAKFNARFVNGKFVQEGESILIDGSQKNVEYKPKCGYCYKKLKDENKK